MCYRFMGASPDLSSFCANIISKQFALDIFLLVLLKLSFIFGAFVIVSMGVSDNTINLSCRNGLSADSNKISFAEMATDDAQTSREERCFRLWINSHGTGTHCNNLFEDVRNG